MDNKGKYCKLVGLLSAEENCWRTDEEYESYFTAEEKRTEGMDESSRNSIDGLLNKDTLKIYIHYKILLGSAQKLVEQLLTAIANNYSQFGDSRLHALIWRNKEEIETISLDELYNNLKIYEPELTGSTNTSQNSQNYPTSGDNVSDAVICAFLASQLNSPQLAREDLEQIDPNDLEEMDLQ
ncbi:hypothetical protein Tco_1132789 [Tanacetum coccineum]|uniref:Uncharacterized protein n=1 Tax=Tanacetum coccineum TaxID=301880 RepID=A0ABQ5JFV2_9ASTR